MKIKTFQTVISISKTIIVFTSFVLATLIALSTLTANGQRIAKPKRCPKRAPATVPVPWVITHIEDFRGRMRILLARVRDFQGTEVQREEYRLSLMRRLKEDFSQLRTTEYSSSQVAMSVVNTCTVGGRSPGRNKKDCGEKCVVSPDAANLYTTAEWLCINNDQKGVEITRNGTYACLRMTRASRGFNTGRIRVLYKFRPESIEKFVKNDWSALLPLIGAN